MLCEWPCLELLPLEPPHLKLLCGYCFLRHSICSEYTLCTLNYAWTHGFCQPIVVVVVDFAALSACCSTSPCMVQCTNHLLLSRHAVVQSSPHMVQHTNHLLSIQFLIQNKKNAVASSTKSALYEIVFNSEGCTCFAIDLCTIPTRTPVSNAHTA